MASEPDYKRLISDRHLGVWYAPTSGVTGVQDPGEPDQAEIRAMQNAAPSISWNDWDFGMQESETTNDPSLADDSTYEDYGQINYGGSVSHYYPQDYDDNSNNHSLVYDMIDQPRTAIDVVTRLDGAKNNVTDLPSDGDFVSVFRTMTDSWEDSDQGADAIRYTTGFLSQGVVAVDTVVGTHTLTAIPPASDPWDAGNKARLRVSVQDRDYTNALEFSSDDPEVVQVYPGGFYEVTGSASDTADITISDKAAGTTTTVSVTVT